MPHPKYRLYLLIGVSRGGSFSWTPLFICDPPYHPTRSHRQMLCKLFLNCLICSLGQHFIDIKGSKYMLVHSLASKYARFVVLGRLMYWTTPPPHQTIGPPPLLKSDDLFLGNQEILDPPFQKSWTRP